MIAPRCRFRNCVHNCRCTSIETVLHAAASARERGVVQTSASAVVRERNVLHASALAPGALGDSSHKEAPLKLQNIRTYLCTYGLGVVRKPHHEASARDGPTQDPPTHTVPSPHTHPPPPFPSPVPPRSPLSPHPHPPTFQYLLEHKNATYVRARTYVRT